MEYIKYRSYGTNRIKFTLIFIEGLNICIVIIYDDSTNNLLVISIAFTLYNLL